MLRNALVLMAMSLSLTACGVGQDAHEPEVSEAGAERLGSQEQNICEPGPSANWCQNVAGKACSTTVNRRCYIPNYCEWSFCRCTAGAWQCE